MNGSSSGASATQSSPLSQSYNVPISNTVSNLPSTINSSRTASSTSQIQVCRFFLNKRTCPYGKQCRFQHLTTNPPVCKHFLASNCHYGDRCKFYHPDPTEPSGFHDNEKQFESPVQPLLDVNSFPSISTSLSNKCTKPRPLSTHTNPQLSPCQERQRESRTRGGPPELQLEAFFKRAAMIQPLPAMSRPKPKKASGDNSMFGMRNLRDIEIEQLERLYPSNEHRLVEKSGDHYVYIINFQPSDPDWPYKVTTLNVMISFPSGYPLKPCKVEVTDDNHLPISCIIAINDALNEQSNQLHTNNQLSGNYTLMFRPLLHWLDKYVTGIIASCNELPLLKTADPSTSEDISEEDITNSSEENRERDKDEGEDDDTKSSRYVCPAKRGTEVRLMGLQLSDGIATVQVSVVKVTMECTRCHNHQDIICKNESPVSQSCTKCHCCMAVTVHSDIVHASNPSLCFMDLLGCKPIDLILSSCEGVITCIECNREVSLKGLTYGQPWTTCCRYCHTSLSISLDQCKFYIHQSGQAPPTDGSIKQTVKKTKRLVEFSEGHPLPELGTCKHYKKSHRWLRFPCCGKVYPCDVCHDTAEDHPMEIANRMICGYCSREQTYNGTKPCTLCGSDLAHVRVSSHWEGGQGCRNKSKMSRNDGQKYKNSTNKTQSMKNERVGVKGKANQAKQ